MALTYHRGTIAGLRCSWASGLAFLLLGPGSAPDAHDVIPCDNGPTVRALDACFGDVITPDHGVDPGPIVGQDIVYAVDELGLLYGFSPADEWEGPDDLIED